MMRIGPIAHQLTEYLNNHSHKAYYGRIVKAGIDVNPASKEYLCDANQLFPFVMGPETIHQLKERSVWDMFNFIGYARKYVLRRISEGERYHLILFCGYHTDDSHREPLLATWDNVIQLIDETNPEIGQRVKAVLPVIKSTKYDDFEFDVEEIAPELYRQVSSFEEFAKTNYTSPTLVRAFLRHTMKLMRLYSGDGYTYDDDGIQGSKEYLMPRVKISQLVEPTDFFPLWKDIE